MQANNTSHFFKNVIIGLLASGAGAFVAMPASAMPEPAETGAAVDESVEEVTEAIEEVPVPAAEDTLPAPEAEVVTEADALAEEEPVAEEAATEEEPVAEEAVTEEEPVADEVTVEEEPVAEEAATEEEPVADEVMAEEEPIADEAVTEEEPVADEVMAEEEPVAEGEVEVIDADTVEAAEIETLSDEAIEASDTMDGEPVVEEPVVEEEPVADEAVTEEEPVAEEAATEEEPVAEGEEINTQDFTISQLTDNSDSFEILAAALAAADLTEILGSEGPFTVFAPTDEAFADLPEGAVEQLMLPENKDALVQVLTYHVVPGAILSTDLESGEVATVEGSDLTVSVEDTVTVNNANVVVTDIEASNGVIHIIDRVIIPPAPEADASVEETAAAE